MSDEKAPKDEFPDDEADAWFHRNAGHIVERERQLDRDLVMELITRYHLHPHRVLDIGCANGYRLAGICERYSAEGFGIDPSTEAIADGKTRYPHLHLQAGTAERLAHVEDHTIDLVVINFVFHWIERARLFQSVAEIDRVLTEEGILIIGDFDPEHPSKRRYHHRSDLELYTYKQPYWRMFEASCLYTMLAKESFTFAGERREASIPLRERCALAMLQRGVAAQYVEE